MGDEQRLADYRAYYRARAVRYRTDPLYPETARAQAALAEAVDQATSITDLNHRVLSGGLALECGRALAKDQANARAALFARTDETVRAQASTEVLAGVDAVADAPALAALTSGAEQNAGRAVTADELTRLWTLSLTNLENVEVWQSAVVPPRWRGELDRRSAEALRSEREIWAGVGAEAQQHAAGWRFDERVARAPRHRRLVPIPDTAFESRLAGHRELVRGEQG